MALREYQTSLINKLYEAWNNGYKAPCIVLPCGGGKSVITAEIAKKHTDKNKSVLFLVHRRELVEQIENTFAEWGVNMLMCQIGMVQTISRRLKTISVPNLIITDENHHSLANSYKRIYDYFSDVKRVGVTATPERLGGKGLKDVNDILIEGVTAKWLIDNHFLSPYKLYSRNLNMPKFHIQNGDYKTSEVVGFFNSNAKQIFGDTIAEYKRLANNMQVVCYLPSVEISKTMADKFTASNIKAEHIDGETPKAERKAIIERFRTGTTKILCNVDIISEGFDVPDCQCAILLRPTKSLSLYIQQSMRCMRYKDCKQAIILDQVGNYTTHGMPDDDRVWTLEDKPKKKKEKIQSKELPEEKKCPHCEEIIKVQVKKCPYCGYSFESGYIKTNEELVEIKATMQPNQCHSMAELYRLAELRGYKRGWAYYQGKRLGLLGKITDDEIVLNVKKSNTGKKYPCKGLV